jgi:hypothetical protein
MAIPAFLQHLWLNFAYAPELITSFAAISVVVFAIKFGAIVKFWEKKLLQTNAE